MTSKNVMVLGGMMTSTLALLLAPHGVNVYSPNDKTMQPRQTKQFARIDTSDCKLPVNGYQKKQRKNKARKRSKRDD